MRWRRFITFEKINVSGVTIESVQTIFTVRDRIMLVTREKRKIERSVLVVGCFLKTNEPIKNMACKDTYWMAIFLIYTIEIKDDNSIVR
jgi:uncharacterized protein with PIN domain